MRKFIYFVFQLAYLSVQRHKRKPNVLPQVTSVYQQQKKTKHVQNSILQCQQQQMIKNEDGVVEPAIMPSSNRTALMLRTRDLLNYQAPAKRIKTENSLSFLSKTKKNTVRACPYDAGQSRLAPSTSTAGEIIYNPMGTHNRDAIRVRIGCPELRPQVIDQLPGRSSRFSAMSALKNACKDIGDGYLSITPFNVAHPS